MAELVSIRSNDSRAQRGCLFLGGRRTVNTDAVVPDRAVMRSPIGALEIRASDTALYAIDYLDAAGNPASGSPNVLIAETTRQLNAYFDDPGFRFSLPLAPLGTPFQLKVWEALCGIAYGKTESYGSLAKRLDSGARAVGNACRNNPIPIIIPCHRVLKADGRLGGYSGQLDGRPVSRKAWLLAHEARLRGG